MNRLPRRCRKPATATNIQDEPEIVMHARNFGERRRISLKTPRFVVCFQGFGGMAEWLKAAVLKTVKPQGFVGSNPTASARNAARPEPAGSGRFSLFGPAFRLELPAHERMFHVKHSRGGSFARMGPTLAVHDRAAHAQQNRRFGRPSPSPSIEGNT